MTILEKIISQKRKEVVEAFERRPVKKLEQSKFFRRITLPLTDYIVNPDKTGIIAEFKRKSPSKGIINSIATIEEVTTGYFRSGASGLSILTDKKFFGGSVADLTRARELNPIPILRKDFVIDEYQIIEAKAIGADAILLIAAALDKSRAKELARFARSLHLQVLLEVHNAAELDHLNEFVNIVGVNNRDLKTFAVDIEISVQLAGEIPPEFVKISESGITSPLTLKRLKGCGYQGFLIGENFMRTPEPALAFSDFVKLVFCEYN
jgi:indole-3-glycerol phosphate synthase